MKRTASMNPAAGAMTGVGVQSIPRTIIASADTSQSAVMSSATRAMTAVAASATPSTMAGSDRIATAAFP